jgi:hypothetical protein
MFQLESSLEDMRIVNVLPRRGNAYTVPASPGPPKTRPPNWISPPPDGGSEPEPDSGDVPGPVPMPGEGDSDGDGGPYGALQRKCLFVYSFICDRTS